MVITCEIKFEENSAGTYYNGELVSGTATINVDKPIDVRAVTLQIKGSSKTNWTERNVSKRIVYAGREDYMSANTFLMGSDEMQKLTIPAGIHTYNFAAQLPYKCPSSFEGNHGSIRYMVKIILFRNSQVPMVFARGFTVLKGVDLNFETPALRIPSSSETYKTFCCGPCTTEPIKLLLSLPQTGFVAGQYIPVNVVVINNSSLPVVETIFSLVMLVRYYSQTPEAHTNIEKILVTTVKGDGVLRRSTRSISQQIRVPATSPTCLNLCKLIQTAYHVEVKAKMGSMHESQSVTMPVIIGTIPIRTIAIPAVIEHQPKRMRSHDDANGNATEKSETHKRELPIMESVMRARGVSNDFSIAQPTYEESEHMLRADIRDDEGEQEFAPCNFTPLYPVFDLPSSVPPAPAVTNGLNNGSSDNQNYHT